MCKEVDEMKMIPEVGDVITVKEFAFSQANGGTVLSDQQIKCQITKTWYDYECGWRYHAKPLEKVEHEKYTGDGKIYVSQFDMVVE